MKVRTTYRTRVACPTCGPAGMVERLAVLVDDRGVLVVTCEKHHPPRLVVTAQLRNKAIRK